MSVHNEEMSVDWRKPNLWFCEQRSAAGQDYMSETVILSENIFDYAKSYNGRFL